jgi:alkylated DNA repair dioxygenase AlkB
VSLSWQESLFDDPVPGTRTPREPRSGTSGEPRPPSDAGRTGDPVPAVPTAASSGQLTVHGVHRLELDERSWVDVSRGWYPDHAGLFSALLDAAPWQQRQRHMYEQRVLEPRLVASWAGDTLADLPRPLREIRTAVSRHYAADFDSVLVNLYRDGRDGVAWHGDTVRHRLDEAVVVTVALGERRRFLLRPGISGPPAHTLLSGEGDLVVMGGRCQHEWQHTVPKAARAGARMSITLRHSLPLRG